MGLTLPYYWSLNPKQWEKHLKVFNEKERERLEEIDTLNWILGKYIAYAVNEPKKYPTQPFSQKTSVLEPMSDEDMERQARHNTIKMGGVINDC